MIRLTFWTALIGILMTGPAVAQQGVRQTVHNLSASGPGVVRSGTESEVCIFCHTPHGANPEQRPIWNRTFSGATYTPYSSPSAQAAIGQPNGDSKLCLSCHDGTIALGSVLNLRGAPGTIPVNNANPDGRMPAGPTLIGTNLLNDHPVSFTFDATLAINDGELADPGTLTGSVTLRPGSTPGVLDAVQCTTCHDPHTDVLPKFLRQDRMGQTDNLCLTCHTKSGWAGSTHESAAQFWPSGQSVTRVADHSCVACHTPHTDAGAERLLRQAEVGGQSAIEEACYRCHQSGGSGGIAPNIQAEFQKPNGHPITMNPGGHRPVFTPRPPGGLPENVLLDPGSLSEDGNFTDVAHVECVDCHNPHRVTASNRTEGIRGIGLDGNEVANVTNDPVPADNQASVTQYPLCFRCHGDSYANVLGTLPLLSGATPSNKRTEFQTTNSSFHPVAGPGRNRSPNLDAQLAGAGLGINSVIKCTDCHNSDAYENTVGRVPSTGLTDDTPVGPHGSIYSSILRANFQNTLPGPNAWDPANFDLCFRCHNENMLMARRWGDGARTNFYDDSGNDNLHFLHLDDRVDKSRPICQSCHYNIHSNEEAQNTQWRIDGVVYTSPPPGVTTRLINFHPNIRATGGRARPEWRLDTTTGRRRCYLQCHRSNGGPGGDVMVGSDHFYTGPPSGDVP